MIKFFNSTKVFFFLILLLALFVSYSALEIRVNFENNNIPVYDGVLYEYQQLNRFQKFNHDFSFLNRYSQAVYEFRGNPVGGLYTSLITFFFPKFLANNLDVFFRSFVGFFIFSISFFLFFRKKYSDFWTFLLLILITQIPFLYHYRIGLGAYTPELIGSVYLIGGYLFLLLFILDKKITYFSIGIFSLLFPLAFRFNFFAYASLLILPLIILFIIDFSNFSNKTLKFILLIGITLTSIFIFNFFYHFNSFYAYYTTVCYAIDNLKSSCFYYSQNFLEFYTYKYFIILFFVICGNFLFKKKNATNLFSNKFLEAFILCFPYLVYTFFIIFIMKSTNTPHITSISFFFATLFLPLFNFEKLIPSLSNFTQKIKISYVFLFLIFFFCSVNELSNDFFKNTNNHYFAQRFTVDFLKKNNFKSMFICYDAMLDIPINTALYNDSKKMIKNTGFFVTNDIYLKYSCNTESNCLENFINSLENADIIMINEQENDHYIFPIAKRIRIKLRQNLLTSKHHKLILKKYFPYYGNILFYSKI
jgi:hypothetical protein